MEESSLYSSIAVNHGNMHKGVNDDFTLCSLKLETLCSHPPYSQDVGKVNCKEMLYLAPS